MNELGEGQRNEFLAWYESQKESVYDNRQALESYCQDDVTVIRQTSVPVMFNRVKNVVIFCVLVLSSLYLGDVYGVEYLTDGTLYRPSSLVKKI